MATNTTIHVSVVVASDTAWLATSSVLVFLMVPGVAYYYGGVSRTKNKLTAILSSFLASALISIEWYLWGYSLAFSSTGSVFIGDMQHVVLSDVGDKPTALAPTIPHNCFMIFQCMFAAVTATLIFGSVMERTSLRAFLVFLVFWSVFVYDIVAYWVWAQKGWLKQLGVLDFAGGIPVHIVTGFSSMAYTLSVGPRSEFRQKQLGPVNLFDICIGTALSWVGWFGFNAGSQLTINSRSINAIVITNLAASLGGICWILMDMILKKDFKFSLVGFCNGAFVGLVAITPAAGFVSPSSSLVFGALAGFCCCASTRLKNLKFVAFDDVPDVFAGLFYYFYALSVSKAISYLIHGVGGIIGCLLTGLFADNSVVTMSGDLATGAGGWLNGNYIQLLWQLVGVVCAAAWSFGISLIILSLIRFIPCLKLRYSVEIEERGADLYELNERSYEMDFVVGDEKNTEQSLIHSTKVLNKTPNKISNLIPNDAPNGNINHTFTLV